MDKFKSEMTMAGKEKRSLKLARIFCKAYLRSRTVQIAVHGIRNTRISLLDSNVFSDDYFLALYDTDVVEINQFNYATICQEPISSSLPPEPTISSILSPQPLPSSALPQL